MIFRMVQEVADEHKRMGSLFVNCFRYKFGVSLLYIQLNSRPYDSKFHHDQVLFLRLNAIVNMLVKHIPSMRVQP